MIFSFNSCCILNAIHVVIKFEIMTTSGTLLWLITIHIGEKINHSIQLHKKDNSFIFIHRKSLSNVDFFLHEFNLSM